MHGIHGVPNGLSDEGVVYRRARQKTRELLEVLLQVLQGVRAALVIHYVGPGSQGRDAAIWRYAKKPEVVMSHITRSLPGRLGTEQLCNVHGLEYSGDVDNHDIRGEGRKNQLHEGSTDRFHDSVSSPFRKNFIELIDVLCSCERASTPLAAIYADGKPCKNSEPRVPAEYA